MNHPAVPPAPTFATALPVRRVGFDAPWRWLGAGWRDLRRQPAASLFYGVCIALAGALILTITLHLPFLFTAAVSGFLLVAPLLATGIYELSRRHANAEPASLVDSMRAWRRNPSAMFNFGLLALVAGTVWQAISALLIAVFYKGAATTPHGMVLDILLDPAYTHLFLLYMGIGGVLAALMFAISVVSMPMLLDRQCEMSTALATSLSAVAENPGPLAWWASVIMLLSMLGFATALIGFIIILPWLGHASFHAYRELVA